MKSYKKTTFLNFLTAGLLFLFITLSNQYSFAQIKKTAKRKKIENEQTRFIYKYRSQLTKNNPDSALKLWMANDSTIAKIDQGTRNLLLTELAINFDKNKLYNSSLAIYNKIFNYKKEIVSPLEIATVNSLVNIYSQASATDSLDKYLTALNNYYKKTKKKDLTLLSKYARLYYLKGNFDTAAYYIQQYKKATVNHAIPSSLSNLVTKMLYNTGNYDNALEEVKKNISLAKENGDQNIVVKNELLEIDIQTDLGIEKKLLTNQKKCLSYIKKTQA